MRDVKNYALVTACYWAFTLTDGALRMLVLLYLHGLGYSPLELASLFVLYEFFGVVTNLLGGWLGTRFGLRSTLVSGLALQVGACAMLAVDEAWLSVLYVMSAQALSGVAKDLTKMSSKSYIKQVVPENDPAGLMRWVALLTGSKNTLKGVGFFLGGASLTVLGFRATCAVMAGLILAVLLFAALRLPRATAKAGRAVKWRELLSTDARINWLSAARLFLFGARDAWFVIALPLFLATELGWSHAGVGGFLAGWVILYGFVQAAAPRWTTGRGDSPSPNASHLIGWKAALLLSLGALLLGMDSGWPQTPTMIVGLGLFGAAFATCSAVHSYLIVAYAAEDEVALRVGFYYMANALGRLIGTVLSGLVYQSAGQGWAGLRACLLVSAGMIAVSAWLCRPLRRAERACVAEAPPA